MNYYNILVTSVDCNEDIPIQEWQQWFRKDLATAEGTYAQLLPQWQSGDFRRLLLIENSYDCVTGAVSSKLIKAVRHPIQKKVIYNKQKPIPKAVEPMGEVNWAALAQKFNEV